MEELHHLAPQLARHEQRWGLHAIFWILTYNGPKGPGELNGTVALLR